MILRMGWFTALAMAVLFAALPPGGSLIDDDDTTMMSEHLVLLWPAPVPSAA